jgi:hypothetical protein
MHHRTLNKGGEEQIHLPILKSKLEISSATLGKECRISSILFLLFSKPCFVCFRLEKKHTNRI